MTLSFDKIMKRLIFAYTRIALLFDKIHEARYLHTDMYYLLT